jgi:hypothetical protein
MWRFDSMVKLSLCNRRVSLEILIIIYELLDLIFIYFCDLFNRNVRWQAGWLKAYKKMNELFVVFSNLHRIEDALTAI